MAENGDIEGIDEIIKNNYNNLKKFNLSTLNMVEIFFKYKQYDKAVKTIKLLNDPFYFQYKIDMMIEMNKLEDALEIVITDKNIDIDNMDFILKGIIKNNPNLLKKAKELALKYKVAINID